MASRSKSRKKPTPARRRRAAVPIPVRGVDFIMYHAPDVVRTRRFYRELFGLERGGEWNAGWSEFATEPVTFALNGPPEAHRLDWDWSGPPCLAFAVADVPAAIETCRRRGVKVLIEPVETRVCWMAWIADPDGNRVCLHSRKDGTAG